MSPEGFFTAKEIARTLPGQPDPGTVRAWMKAGIGTFKGRVKLKHEQIGTVLYTTSAWVDEFLKTVRENGVPSKRTSRQISMAM